MDVFALTVLRSTVRASTRGAVFILFVLAASLAVTPSVTAQTPGGGLLVVRVCGANGCKAIFNEQTEEASGPTTPDFFVPGAGVLRARADPGRLAEQQWIRLSDDKRAALREALRDVEPFPAPRVTQALIAGRRADDPERAT